MRRIRQARRGSTTRSTIAGVSQRHVRIVAVPCGVCIQRPPAYRIRRQHNGVARFGALRRRVYKSRRCTRHERRRGVRTAGLCRVRVARATYGVRRQDHCLARLTS